MSTPEGDPESQNESSPQRESQNEESDDDDDSMSDSSSSSSSDSSDSSSSSDTESVATTSRSSDLRTCPLRSLLTNYGEERPYSPISTDFSERNDTTGPVDPVFVDEESSGEAVASAADQDDLDLMPPLPDFISSDKPPLPQEDEPDAKRMKLDEHTEVEVKEEQLEPILQEEEDIVEEDDDELESLADDELEALLDDNILIPKKTPENVVPQCQYVKHKVIEKGKNHFDVLPNGWVKVPHHSGMPLYLHRPSRSVTLSRPYSLGPAAVRRHQIPINAIPCLNYKKALEEEEIARQKEKGLFPTAKVESVEENIKKASLNPEEYRQYCQKLFLFKEIKVKNFKSWNDRRNYFKQAQKEMIEEAKKAVHNDDNSKTSRPALPEGTKIISIPVVELEQKNPNAKDNALQQKIVRKSKKDWVLNPAGKSTICILHEYLQHSVKKAPTYKYQEMDSSTTPYSAVVEINGIEYGRGAGSSKKEAKSEAARLTLEILIPEFKNNLNAKNGVVIKESVDLSFFDEIRIEDPRVSELCNKTSEPSPYAILLTCLQKNHGLGDTSIKTDLTPARNRKNRFTMQVSEQVVEVICRNKRDGKQMASQKLLQKLHPNITSWGALLKLYGSRAISAQKNKKERESEVTGLQTPRGSSSHTSPNVAILAKLRSEMKLLAECKKTRAPIGKLTLNSSLMDPNQMPSNSGATLNRISL